MLFIISGPSGCGKSTLAQRALSELDHLKFSVSHTTRDIRGDEKDGVDYHFVSKTEFDRLVKSNNMIEWAEVHGNLYGTSSLEVEKKGTWDDVLLDIDVQGAQQIKNRVKKAVFIFVLPPVYRVLQKRLLKRGQNTPAEVNSRLEIARREIRSYPQFDFVIVDDDLDKAVEELKSIIVSTRCRLNVRQKEILPILRSFSEEDWS